MTLPALIAIGLLVAVFAWLIFHPVASTLVIQMSDEETLRMLADFLNQRGIGTFMKNMESQGVIVRRGGPSANASLHVVESQELPRAKKLTAEFFRTR